MPRDALALLEGLLGNRIDEHVRRVRLVRTTDARDQVRNFRIWADEIASVRSFPVEIVVLQHEKEVRALRNKLIKRQRCGQIVWQRHDVANMQHSDSMLVDIALDLPTDHLSAAVDLG